MNARSARLMFPPEPPTAQDNELQRLAATRAALDPDRQQRRADILLNAAVEFLSTKGDQSTRSMVRAINEIWHTSSVTEPELEAALRQAQSIGLVVTIDDLSGDRKWKATEGSITESQQDREWAQNVLSQFDALVSERLDELGFELDAEELKRSARQLLRALAEGCRVANMAPGIGVEFLRPVEFAAGAVRSALNGVAPKSTRLAVSELVDAALDPDDPFANEVIHLLIVGSVLQAFVSKRDLGAQPNLNGTRLLLDTPVLVDFVDDGSSNQRVVQNLIELSLRLGAQVVVAEHSLKEWDRVWEGAELERPFLFDERSVPEHLDRLTASKRSNPFVAQFLREKAKAPNLTWARFKIGHSNIRHRLQNAKVQVRECGNDTIEDRQVVADIIAQLSEITDDETVPGKRSRVAAEADANSTAMVARWRAKYPVTPCGAFFVSSEYLTGLAYERACPHDMVPLTARPAAWTVYAASLVSDDPEQRAEIAEMIGDAVFRESFLGLATAYTLEEAALLADLLVEQDTLSIVDSRTAVQLDLMQLLSDHSTSTAQERVAVVGAEVIRRRSTRRDARAKRVERRSAEVLAAVERARVTEVRVLSTKVDQLEEVGAVRDSTLHSQQDTIRHLKRAIGVLIGTVAIAASIGGLVASGELHGVSEALACLFAGAFLLDGVRYAMKLDVRWWEPLIAGAITAIWTGIGAVLGSGH
jgi:hypothetical protein